MIGINQDTKDELRLSDETKYEPGRYVASGAG
jgi:hypothetical protein